MTSSVCLSMKLMICFVFLGTLIQIINTQPIINGEEDQAQAYDPMLNNYIFGSSRLASHHPYQFRIPENLYDYYQQQQQQIFHPNKQYNPDNLQLAKRIIMLPRVGRRSIRSALQK